MMLLDLLGSFLYAGFIILLFKIDIIHINSFK